MKVEAFEYDDLMLKLAAIKSNLSNWSFNLSNYRLTEDEGKAVLAAILLVRNLTGDEYAEILKRLPEVE